MVPPRPIGTDTMKTRRQSTAASTPPRIEPDELAGDAGHLVDAHGGAALVGRERVGQDRGRVGHQHGAADRLDDPEADQPQRARSAR